MQELLFFGVLKFDFSGPTLVSECLLNERAAAGVRSFWKLAILCPEWIWATSCCPISGAGAIAFRDCWLPIETRAVSQMVQQPAAPIRVTASETAPFPLAASAPIQNLVQGDSHVAPDRLA